MAGVEMRYDCYKLMQAQGHEEPTGKAKITSGHHLPARFVLHTVGPVVRGRLTEDHKKLLADCYRACLNFAENHMLASVAFCCIATGVFRFPQEQAAMIAVRTVREWLDEHLGSSVRRVIFDVYQEKDREIYTSILS